MPVNPHFGLYKATVDLEDVFVSTSDDETRSLLAIERQFATALSRLWDALQAGGSGSFSDGCAATVLT
jgi:hypothetical protein